MTCKRTLCTCVGVNEYKIADANLRGCVNDAIDMAAFFDRLMPSATGQILIDGAATKRRIMDTLGKMVELAKQDRSISRLLFSMSSHGSQVTDTDGDEKDSLDECLLPHDAEIKHGGLVRSSVIIDDELNALFSQVPKRVLIEVWMDSCFSGTGLRLLPGANGVSRYYANAVVTAKPRKVRKFRRNLPNTVLWSGCSDTQTSADAEIDGRWCGAMTCSFMQAFDMTKSRGAINRAMRKWLKDNDYAQTPQLECEMLHKLAPMV